MNSQTQHASASPSNSGNSSKEFEKFDAAARIERLMNTVRPPIHTDAITKVAPPSKKPRS